MSSSFADFGVPTDLVGVLAARGIDQPFPIQAATLPDALAGRDVIGRAPTGSGKTIAFGLAVVDRVAAAKPGRPTALILAPTRELAEQIRRELEPLAAKRGRRVAAVYGGTGYGAQLNALRRGIDILVACPGRLEDLIQRRDVALGDVGIVVLDEADRMADMGFMPAMRRILDQVRDDRQTLLFSATLDGEVDKLARTYQRDPARHSSEPEARSTGDVRHLFWRVKTEDRLDLLVDVALRAGTVIAFCRTRHGVDRLAKRLNAAGVGAANLHGARSQSQRERALHAFTTGRLPVLVATDVAARGIHVDQVGCVVHFDPPADPADYVHRSGRTGRAGEDGLVISFVSKQDEHAVRKLIGRLGLDAAIEPVDLDVLGPVRPLPTAPREQADQRPEQGAQSPNAPRRRRPRPAGQSAGHPRGKARRKRRAVATA